MGTQTKLTAIRLVLCGFIVFSLGLSNSAKATLVFEIAGGSEEIQDFTAHDSLTNIIPNGSWGFENRQDDLNLPANSNVISIRLIDDSNPAASGTVRIRFDYIGTDASFVNQFTAGTTGDDEFIWCNKGTVGPPAPAPNLGDLCAPVATRVGMGNNDFFGNFKQTAYIDLTIGDLVPFNFSVTPVDSSGVAGALRTFSNGESIFDAHMGVFSLAGGAFDMSGPPLDRTSKVLLLGLTDGNTDIPMDDDHQDFMVRISVVPEPGTLALFGIGLLGFIVTRRRLPSLN